MENKWVSKQQMAYEKIKEAIITEKYEPDQFLSGREICATLGISRTPVMEALRRLAYEGFVESVPDRGIFVARVRFEDFIELYEIRLGMESIAARLCAVRKTASDLERMEEALLFYENETKKGNYLKAIQKDDEFHMLVISGAKNSRMENMLRIVLEQCSRAVTLSASAPNRMEQVIIPAHRKIFDAIADGAPDRAEIAVREHILNVQEFFTQYQIKHHYIMK